MRVSKLIPAVIGLSSLAMFGCPGTDPLSGSFSDLTASASLEISASTRWDRTLVQVEQIFIEPTDPAAQAANGSASLGLISTSLLADLDGTANIDLSSTNLPGGTYEVVGVRVSVQFVTDDNPPASPATCFENFARLPPDLSAQNANIVFAPAVIVPVGDTNFTLGGSTTTLQFVFDQETIGGAIEAGLFCRDAVGDSCTYVLGANLPSPCIVNFANTVPYTAALFGAVRVVAP